jgi:hypothetical protein
LNLEKKDMSLTSLLLILELEEAKLLKKCLDKYLEDNGIFQDHLNYHKIVLKLLLAESELVERRKEDVSKRGV